jgi:signal transduction histidine kinase
MEHVSAIEELGPPPEATTRRAGRFAARIRQPVFLDAALAAGLAVLAIVETLPKNMLPVDVWPMLWSNVLRDVAIVLGISIPMLFRRHYPLAAVVVVLGVVGLGGLDTTAGGISAIVAIFSVALYPKDRTRSLAGLALVIGIFILVWTVNSPSPADLAWVAFLISGVGAIWLAGETIRGRTLRANDMERRAVELELRQADELERAKTEERARIARELHDVIAHNLSVVVIQAGAALKVQDEQPEAAREALRQVEASGRQAMTEMRRLLGVLRRGESDRSPTAPQPGLAALPALLDEMRSAGLDIELKEDGERPQLPPGVDVSAYRIVQEALTNVLRHANATRATVELLYRPRSIEIAVLDDGRGSSATTGDPTGHGLAGMHERADLFEGTFQAGPMREGGFAVRASLPTDPRPA